MTGVSDSLDKDFASAWRPEPGDKLVGEIVELSERDGTFGRYPIVTVRAENGEEVAVHAFHDVLSNELARVAPVVRDTIGIKYLGRHPERNYHLYRVRRAGGDRGFNWGQYGGADTPPPSAPDVPFDDADFSASSERGESGPEDPDDDIPFLWEGPLTFADVKYHPNRTLKGMR